jgi:hypothetical protein
MRHFLGGLVLLAVGACSDATALGSDLLRINVLPDALELVNSSEQPVYTFIIERDAQAYVDWVVCTDPSTCNGIAAGGSRVVPYDAIVAYTAGAEEAVVHHWHLIPDGTGFRPDSVRSTVVQLHADH